MAGQPDPAHSRQLEREAGQRAMAERRLAERPAAPLLQRYLLQRHLNAYLDVVLDSWRRCAQRRATKAAHCWVLFQDEQQVQTVALEALALMMLRMPAGADQGRNMLARTLGMRIEMALFLAHPHWRNSWSYKAAQQSMGYDRNKEAAAYRLFDRLRHETHRKGSQLYKPMTRLQHTALGMVFIEAACLTMPYLQRSQRLVAGRREATVRFTDAYYRTLDRWQEMALQAGAPVSNRPMLCPPGDRIRGAENMREGGYLSIGTPLVMCSEKQYPELIANVEDYVVGSINALQRTPLTIYRPTLEVMLQAWQKGIAIGSLPSMERPAKPRKGGTDYWRRFVRWAALRRQDGMRIRTSRALAEAQDLGEKPWWSPWHMDYRGRAYPDSGSLSWCGPDHIRALACFAERAPLTSKGLGYVLGEHVGLPPSWEDRERWLVENRDLILAIAANPLGQAPLWRDWKNPWRGLQAALEAARWLEDPYHQSGLVGCLDQTNSGYGHVACITRSRELARLSNVIGSTRNDLYLDVLARAKAMWLNTEGDEEARTLACWWYDHADRSVSKAVAMPRIYGSRYPSAVASCHEFVLSVALDEHVEGVSSQRMAHAGAKVLYRAAGETVPGLLALAHRVTAWAKANLGPDGATYLHPSGLRNWYFSRTPGPRRQLKLPVAGTTLRIQTMEEGTKLTVPQGARGLLADMIHGYDAAFLHGVVNRWVGPCITAHDSFGVHACLLPELQDTLLSAFREFHRFQQRPMLEVGPPIVDEDWDPEEVGRNPALFS